MGSYQCSYQKLIAWQGCCPEACFTLQVFFKIISGYRPQVPADMPDGYATLMQACWHERPEERPPFEDIVSYLRSLYLDVKNGSGQGRDARRSLDLNPWG